MLIPVLGSIDCLIVIELQVVYFQKCLDPIAPCTTILLDAQTT
jgi:hypothetical protein